MAKPRAVKGLDLKRFWDVIAASCRHDAAPDEWQDALMRQLARLPPDDILDFHLRFDEFTEAAYSVDLWGAAYLLNNGADDDGFYYFRCWLVGMGKKVYEVALADPDSLVDVADPDQDYYEPGIWIYSAPLRAWEEATGRSVDDCYAELDRRPRRRPPNKLRGKDWDFDDHRQVRRRLPRLAALYLSDDGE